MAMHGTQWSILPQSHRLAPALRQRRLRQWLHKVLVIIGLGICVVVMICMVTRGAAVRLRAAPAPMRPMPREMITGYPWEATIAAMQAHCAETGEYSVCGGHVKTGCGRGGHGAVALDGRAGTGNTGRSCGCVHTMTRGIGHSLRGAACMGHFTSTPSSQSWATVGARAVPVGSRTCRSSKRHWGLH